MSGRGYPRNQKEMVSGYDEKECTQKTFGIMAYDGWLKSCNELLLQQETYMIAQVWRK